MSPSNESGEKGSRPRLYLIDGSSFVFRAYFALPSLSTRSGEPTGAVYGFANMLLKTLREGHATHIAVAFDASEPTFRHKMYDRYKANRVEPPEELKPQFARIREVVDALNLPVLRKAGWEADDLMGTLALRARDRGFDVVLVTGDKDFMQLVSPGIRMYDGMRDRWFDEVEVEERFGVPPRLVTDAMALIGDTSDNIPGVRGIGVKTAGPLIARFGSLESLLESIDELSSESQKKKLSEGREIALLSKRLVTIDTESPVEIEPEDLGVREPNIDRLRALLSELEFTRLIDELVPEKQLSTADYSVVDSIPAFEALCKELEDAKVFAVDTETTSLSAMNARLVGLSFSVGEGRAWYIPVGHDYEGALAQLSLDLVLDGLRKLLEDENKPKYVQNTKYDYMVLHRHGVGLRGVIGDPMLFDYLLDPGKGGHGLDALAQAELGHSTIRYSDVAGKGKTEISFSKVAIENAAPYACEDADVTARLAEILAPRIRKEGLWDLFQDVEQPLSTVLADMELSGFLVDKQRLQDISKDLEKGIEISRAEVFSHAGKEFNIASPKQLAEILFKDLGLPVVKRTKTGPSTDVAVLEALAQKHPLPGAILESRRLTKLKNTYVDALPELINPETGRIHTSFSQTTTATGRLSSSDPNLQNIPIRSDYGRRIREAFIAEPGMVLISADYSQIELRVLAHLADDPALIQAFESGSDIHAITASELMGIPLESVRADHRRVAKAINFGILYGMSAFRLANETGMSREDAKRYIKAYFERYNRVSDWIKKTQDEVRETVMVRTILGRKRKLPEIKSKNFNVRSGAERMALNTPIQGSAADIIKVAMLRVHSGLPGVCTESRLILQVHDELVLEVPRHRAQEVSNWLQSQMENAMSISVPLKVEVGWGDNWAVAH